MQPMTKLIDRAVAAVERLPPERQDEIARFLLTLATDPPALTDAERHAIAEADAELARGEVVPTATIAEFWRANDVCGSSGHREPFAISRE